MMMQSHPSEYKKKDLKDIQAIIDVHHLDILRELGFNPDRYGRIQCKCPIHGGDNPQGFSYDPQTKWWHCWTHGCHENFKQNGKSVGSGLVGLVRLMLDKNFPQALEWIEQFTGERAGEINASNMDRKKFINKQYHKFGSTDPNEDPVYDKTILSRMNHKVQYLLDRGFTQETLNTFQCFYSNNKEKPLYGRACLPLFNLESDLIGFTGRKTPVLEESSRKWMYCGTKSLHKHLFGANLFIDRVRELNTVVLVEGPLDVMMCYQNGIDYVLSPFTKTISMDQVKILVQNQVRTVILMFDPDNAGQKGAKSVTEKIKLFFNVHNISNLITKDPGDLSKEEYESIVKPRLEAIINMEKKKYDTK